MYNYLSVIDVSSMLYAGHTAKAYTPRSDTITDNPVVDGLPVGGVRYAVRSILGMISRGDCVVLAFDSRTDKQSLYAEYKGNRAPNPAIRVQQMMLLDFAKALHIPYVKEEGFEADDLVAAVMNQCRSGFVECNIYSGDSDLAANIKDSHTTLVGTASIYPSITKDNYEHIIKKGQFVPYNTILPYYAIYGKASNNVKQIGEKKLCDELFKSFIDYSNSSYVAAGEYSASGHFASWLMQVIDDKQFDLSVVNSLYERIGYVFPKPYEKPIEITPLTSKDLNRSELAFYLKAFNMDSMLTQYDCIGVLSQAKSREMLNYLATYKNSYNSGALAVDAGSTPDTSYFSDASGETMFFVNGDDL